MIPQPLLKTINPCFGSGPTAKRPGWTLEVLKDALVGRSHRAATGITKIQEMLARTRQILKIPDNFHLALVGGSATGAVEMALWNLLGERQVDSLAFDIFGHRWQYQLINQLKLEGLRCINAEEGSLPDLNAINFDHDVVFLWNGSTSGACFSNGEWIPADRKGLTLCDATSAVFAMPLPWDKLDAVAFSWQKGLGSEAGHGMLALSPRAVERLEKYTPPWPIPGLYRLREKGQFLKSLFEGLTINTPSLLCLEDCLDALKWAEVIGGHDALMARSGHNLNIIAEWVKHQSWIEFLAHDPQIRSSSTICLKLKSFQGAREQEWEFLKKMADRLRALDVAYECLNHTSATPSVRIWGGPMVESENIQRLLPWLEWAYEKAKDS